MTDFNLLSKFSIPHTKPIPINSEDKYESTVYTTLEQDKLLIGYDEVSLADIIKLPNKTQISYLLKDGKFRIGGKIHNINLKSTPILIFLESGYGVGYNKWPVAIDNLAKVWKKRTLDTTQAHNEEVEFLKQQVQNMQQTIIDMQTEIKKIIQAVGIVNSRITTSSQGFQGNPNY